MIRLWFDARGVIGRGRFLTETTLTWLIGNLGFLAYFLTKTPVYSFAAYGRLIDHRAEALEAMGLPLAAVALTLWLAQVWALAALSSKRLHDMGQGGWLAGLSLFPGVQILFWIALCYWPAKASSSVRTA
jgi:uncharacterized membrane protein YhaH (DUF805 family)